VEPIEQCHVLALWRKTLSNTSQTNQPVSSDIPWYLSLQFRLLLVFCLCMSVMAIAVILVVERNVNAQVFNNSKAYTIEKGHSVVNRLGQQTAHIEAVANTLARIAESVPKEPQLLHELIPQILEDNDETTIIAGGGIWPEPFKYDENKERHSFFWGRDATGKLDFYDDYNDPEGNGYHNEEWYVPAQYYADGHAYWSQSYMDPYSLEPMVTCTIPYYINSEFSGVVTVDVKLERLYDMFAKEAEEFSGYIFAVDRNNRFLSYPQKEKAKIFSQKDNPQTLTYITADQLLERDENFKLFAEAFHHLEHDAHADAHDDGHQHSPKHVKIEELTQTLEKQSYQISTEYAQLIAQEIYSDHNHTVVKLLDNFINPADPILKASSFNIIFEIPSTHWKLAVVAPLSQLTLPTQEFTRGLLIPLLTTALICLMAALLATQRALITPIRRVTEQLKDFGDSTFPDKAEDYTIKYPTQDELGRLVLSLNQRSASLIDARKQAEIALLSKKNFMANMSHEIRTPMNGILLSAEILTEMPLDETSMHYATIIKNSSVALLDIINEILDYSKLESNKVTIEPIDFDLRGMLDEVGALFQATAERKGLIYSTQIDSNVARYYHVDGHRLRQIIINLVGNAIKFSPIGYVRLAASYDEIKGSLIIKVSDSGIGIAEDKINDIFEQFTQADSSVSRVFGGTGLGLTICSQLIELMEGTIEVTSKLGVGTCFKVSVPMNAVKEVKLVQQPKTLSNLEKDQTFEGELLLVEDNEVNQMLAKRIFERLGFTVITANNGQEAIDFSSKKKYDVIFMDIQMPLIDGITVTQRIRQPGHINFETPIFALSANIDHLFQQECLNAGMQGFVAKPIRVADLLEQLQAIKELHAYSDPQKKHG